MKILIIGGTNFIGPYVVSNLVESGHEVTVFHRGNTENDIPENVRHLHGDRRDLKGWSFEFKRLRPEVVIDMYLMKAADATLLMDTFKGIASRVVAISSMDVYQAYGRLLRIESGPAQPNPLKEDSPLRSVLYPYRGRDKGNQDTEARRSRARQGNQSLDLVEYDKVPVEQIVMAEPDLPATVLRLPCVYGPGDYQHRLFQYLKRMDDGRPAILLNGDMHDWRWTRGYVENVADAIALAADDPLSAGHIYNVGEAEALTEADWVRAIGRAVGWNGEVIAVSPDLLPYPQPNYDWANHLWADTGRIRQELNFKERVSFEHGLLKTATWERENPPSNIDPTQFDYAAEDAVLNKIEP